MTPRQTVAQRAAASGEERLETWRNTMAGRVELKRFNELGQLGRTMVNGGRQFVITPHERRINQGDCASEKQDPFQNGQLQAVELFDDEPDTAALRANPNVLTETEINDLLVGPIEEQHARLQAISNPIAVRRFLQPAIDLDVSLSRMRMIEERLEELSTAVTEVTSAADPSRAAAAPRAVEPR